MDDNCGEWVESMGVATGCGCKEVYRFPHSTYPYSSCFFTAASLLFVLFIKLYKSLLDKIIYGQSHRYSIGRYCSLGQGGSKRWSARSCASFGTVAIASYYRDS